MEFELKFKDGTTRIADIGPFKPFNAVVSSIVKDSLAVGYTYDKVLYDLSTICRYDIVRLKQVLDTASALNLVGIYLNPKGTTNLAHGNNKVFIPLDLTDIDQINSQLNRVSTYTDAQKRV